MSYRDPRQKRAARKADARRAIGAVLAELSAPGSSRRPPDRPPRPALLPPLLQSPLIHPEPVRPVLHTERILALAAD